jgi:hypothetical protein
MSNYSLNGVDLDVYGLKTSHASGSNIALSGCFDMPKRIGTTYHEWDDENGIEPFVAESEIMFEGRDLTLYCGIIDTFTNVNSYLDSLNTAVKNFSDLVSLVTPYGTFQVLVKNIVPDYLNFGSQIVISLREPIVTLTGGSLPAIGTAINKIDNIPFASFGLYLSSAKDQRQLAEMKEHSTTIYGSEGYYIAKRKNNIIVIDGLLVGSSLSDFQSKIKALFLIFKTAGLRTIVIGSTSMTCFAADGFKVSDVHIYTNQVIAKFNISLMVVTLT